MNIINSILEYSGVGFRIPPFYEVHPGAVYFFSIILPLFFLYLLWRGRKKRIVTVGEWQGTAEVLETDYQKLITDETRLKETEENLRDRIAELNSAVDALQALIQEVIQEKDTSPEGDASPDLTPKTGEPDLKDT